MSAQLLLTLILKTIKAAWQTLLLHYKGFVAEFTPQLANHDAHKLLLLFFFFN